ncbi:MAG TPA: DegT/DnrJ/EryC1/StrS aminotransferase family protein [Candidatus Baltobacteraceae bacterium]|nr:DegT/DnrJ/EryC1/StrS aminotransferase family protein [Candidatus Baltobacteraceae bacterium]
MPERFIPYCRPDISDTEIAAVVDSMRNGWLTTGPKVHEFEQAFARASGVKHAVAVNSCTAALHIGLLAAGVQPGDEVVMPALTFVAGAQCTLEIGATPVFCDVDEETLTAHVEQYEQVITPRTKAIIAMPYGGRPMNVKRLAAFARERGLILIEDAAHAVGMLDDGEWAGARSALAAYSFYATKNLTTAEGGVLLTNDDAIMERVRVLSLHGMDRDAWKRYTAKGSWQYDVREPGFKYNMPDIAAAIGIAQLQRLPEMQERRDAIAARYRKAFADVPGLALQKPVEGTRDRHSWCMFAVCIDPDAAGISRDAFIEELKARNVGTSVHYIPTHHFSGYRRFASDYLSVTDRIGRLIVSLPLYPTLSDQEVEQVISAVKSVTIGRKQPAGTLAC